MRRQLGIGASEILMLTVASGYKYNPVEGRSLFDVLDQLLARPNLKIMAIGSDPGHPVFAPLEERHPGKGPDPGQYPHAGSASRGSGSLPG